jgi:hypothetical protein
MRPRRRYLIRDEVELVPAGMGYGFTVADRIGVLPAGEKVRTIVQANGAQLVRAILNINWPGLLRLVREPAYHRVDDENEQHHSQPEE